MTAAVEHIRLPVFIGQPPLNSGAHIIGLERMEDCLAEARKLHEAHWEETEVLYLEDLPIDPDYEQYVAREKTGNFLYFTIRHRETKRLVGNLMYLLHRSLHSRGMSVAHEDAFFILRDHRGGRLAVDLLRYAEQALASIGVTHAGMSDKEPCGGPDLSRFLTKRGYQPVSRFYMKKLSSTGQGD